jgi:ribosomal protein S18
MTILYYNDETDEKIERISPIRIQRTINYKDFKFLKSFISTRGKILSRNISQLTSKQQTKVEKAIKYSRIINLLPFVKYKNIQY